MIRNKFKIKKEYAIDTNNFKEDIFGMHYSWEDEDEFEYVKNWLVNKYKYFDYFTNDDGIYFFASNTVNYDDNDCYYIWKERQGIIE